MLRQPLWEPYSISLSDMRLANPNKLSLTIMPSALLCSRPEPQSACQNKVKNATPFYASRTKIGIAILEEEQDRQMESIRAFCCSKNLTNISTAPNIERAKCIPAWMRASSTGAEQLSNGKTNPPALSAAPSAQDQNHRITDRPALPAQASHHPCACPRGLSCCNPPSAASHAPPCHSAP